MATFPATFTITRELLNQHINQDHHVRDIQCEVTRVLGEVVDSPKEVAHKLQFSTSCRFGMECGQANSVSQE